MVGNWSPLVLSQLFGQGYIKRNCNNFKNFVLVRHRQRQSDAEHGASARLILRPDLPSMSFHDRARNRKTHAHPLLLGREEGFETASQVIQEDARAGIADADLDI